MESIYSLFYSFFATLLGSEATSVHGEIFCRYGTYALVAALVVGIIFAIKKFVGLFTFWR